MPLAVTSRWPADPIAARSPKVEEIIAVMGTVGDERTAVADAGGS